MKARRCKHPYSEYHGYKQVLPNGRTYIYLWNRETDQRKLISRARYRMSVKLGRFLKKDEHVDHKDEDKTNDKIDNLQLLSPTENNRKSAVMNDRTTKYTVLKCPNCGVRFKRESRNVLHRLAAGKRPACSKSCGAAYGATQKPR